MNRSSAGPFTWHEPIDYLSGLRGGYFRLESKRIGRGFHIYVRLPEGYGQDKDRRYPTVYLLDGDVLFPILAPTPFVTAQVVASIGAAMQTPIADRN